MYLVCWFNVMHLLIMVYFIGVIHYICFGLLSLCDALSNFGLFNWYNTFDYVGMLIQRDAFVCYGLLYSSDSLNKIGLLGNHDAFQTCGFLLSNDPLQFSGLPKFWFAIISWYSDYRWCISIIHNLIPMNFLS